MKLRKLRRAIPCCFALLAVAAGPLVVEAFLERPVAASNDRSPLVTGLTVPERTSPLPPGRGMTVTGILGGATRVAIIRTGGGTFIARVGDPVGDAVVTAILPTKVVLKQGHAMFELPLSPVGRTPLVLASPPGGTPPPPGTGMIVTGILEGPTRVAIIHTGGKSFVAGVGYFVGDAVVVAILPGKVVLKENGATFELPIGGRR